MWNEKIFEIVMLFFFFSAASSQNLCIAWWLFWPAQLLSADVHMLYRAFCAVLIRLLIG